MSWKDNCYIHEDDLQWLILSLLEFDIMRFCTFLIERSLKSIRFYPLNLSLENAELEAELIYAPY